MLLLGSSVIESGKETLSGVVLALVSFGGFVESGSTGWKFFVEGPSSISYSIVESVSASVVEIVVTGGADVVDEADTGDVVDDNSWVVVDGGSVLIDDGIGTGSTNFG